MHLLIPAILVIVVSLGAAWAFLGGPVTVKLPEAPALTKVEPAEQREHTTQSITKLSDELGLSREQGRGEATAAATPNSPASPFDIARVEPKGSSVFAGRAAPKSRVTVLADGEAIGTATTDDNGEWVLFVERPLANPNPKLSVTVAGLDTPAPASSPAADGTTRKPAKVRTAAAAMQDLLGELRGMVERAREDGAGSTPPANGAGPTAPAQSGPADGRPSAPQQAPVSGTVNPSRPAAGNERRAIPIPIKFVYQEATFTEDGREAARLLLEYVRLRKLDTLELTGHADERGSPGFNMQLSSARLAAVARFLEQGGYKGKLILRPRGEAEPFQGVDRSLYRPEDLFELDRRVELRVRD